MVKGQIIKVNILGSTQAKVRQIIDQDVFIVLVDGENRGLILLCTMAELGFGTCPECQEAGVIELKKHTCPAHE